MSGAANLSGSWRGIFSYPTTDPATEFMAELVDTAGLLRGRIAEPDLFSPRMIAATLDGRRDGAGVTFAKFYDTADDEYDTVFYAGMLSDDGLEVTGRWDIPGEWSGTFLMIRDMPPAASTEEAAREHLPVAFPSA